MTLALKCGEWDLDAFEQTISASLMTRWERWFARRPQSQYHADRMLAHFFSVFMHSKSCDLTLADFMVDYPPAPEPSIDELCSQALSSLSKKKRPKLAPQVESTNVSGSGNTPDSGLDAVHVGD